MGINVFIKRHEIDNTFKRMLFLIKNLQFCEKKNI